MLYCAPGKVSWVHFALAYSLSGYSAFSSFSFSVLHPMGANSCYIWQHSLPKKFLIHEGHWSLFLLLLMIEGRQLASLHSPVEAFSCPDFPPLYQAHSISLKAWPSGVTCTFGISSCSKAMAWIRCPVEKLEEQVACDFSIKLPTRKVLF